MGIITVELRNLNKERFYENLAKCESIIRDSIGKDYEVNLDFTSKMCSRGIFRDLSLIEELCNKKSRILDFGCGRGTITALISTMDFKVEGVDIPIHDNHTIKFGSTVFEKNKQSKIWKVLEEEFGVRYSFYDGRRIPAPENKFDAIVAHAVMEHIPDKILLDILEEINRVLVPGGLFFIFRSPREHALCETLASFLNITHHEKLIKEREFVALLNRANFDVLRMDRTDLFPSFLPGKMQNLLDRSSHVLYNIDQLLLRTPLNYFAHCLSIVSTKRKLVSARS